MTKIYDFPSASIWTFSQKGSDADPKRFSDIMPSPYFARSGSTERAVIKPGESFAQYIQILAELRIDYAFYHQITVK